MQEIVPKAIGIYKTIGEASDHQGCKNECQMNVCPTFYKHHSYRPKEIITPEIVKNTTNENITLENLKC